MDIHQGKTHIKHMDIHSSMLSPRRLIAPVMFFGELISERYL